MVGGSSSGVSALRLDRRPAAGVGFLPLKKPLKPVHLANILRRARPMVTAFCFASPGAAALVVVSAAAPSKPSGTGAGAGGAGRAAGAAPEAPS